MLGALRRTGLYRDNPAPIAPMTKQPAAGSNYVAAIDITNDLVLYAKNAAVVYDYPASTVKVVTMLLLAELKSANMSDTVTWQNSDDLDGGFSQVGFQNGDVITFADLLRGMLYVSGGDAVQAVARVLGNENTGSPLTSTAGYTRFLEMINARSPSTSRFANGHGAFLHAVTALDMARLAGECFQQPVVQAAAAESNYTINVTGPNARAINIAYNPPVSGPSVKAVKTGSLSGGIYPSTYALTSLWTAPGGQDIAIATMAGGPAEQTSDTQGIIASLVSDFPYLV